MSEKKIKGVARKIPYNRKEVEVRSLLDQITKQEITVGTTMQAFLIQQARENGKEILPLAVMRAQRSYTWFRDMASRYIFSVMVLSDPIKEIYLYDTGENSSYVKVLDGQQRLTTLWMFVNNKIKLDMSKSDYNKFVLFDEEHSVNELEGKTFSELPQKWQDALLNYSQAVVTLRNCSDEQANGIYKRMSTINKPLKAAEIRKADMSDEMYDLLYGSLLSNPWAFHTMTVKSCAGVFGLDIGSQFLVLLHEDKPIELTSESIDRVIHDMSNFGVSEEFKNSVIKINEYLNKVTDIMIESKKETDKTIKKGRRVSHYERYKFPIFKNKTYIVMFLWAGYRAVQNNIDINKFANWTMTFFEKPSSIFARGMGVKGEKPGDFPNVQRRMNAIDEEIEKLK